MIAVALALTFALPTAASAWTVTVRIHGAGDVSEVVNRLGGTRNQGTCSVGPTGRSDSSPPSNCVLGSASGFWSSGDVVRLAPSVSTQAASRGWRYYKWVDGTDPGQTNCDPQGTTGDQISPGFCEFQIFGNLYVDLYFDDVEGPQDTAITDGPASPTKQTTATVNFNAASDPDATFQCRLDRPGLTGSYASCGGPADKSETYSGLTANGTYTAHVRGVDPSGNQDATPASYSWTVDTVAPNPTIGGGPSENSFVSSASASFTVGTNEGSLSACRIDGNPVACGSPVNLSGLGEGAHAFTVEATDTAGNTGSRVRNWTVDTVAPDPQIGGGPAEGSVTPNRGATFNVSSNEPGTLECSLDGVAFSVCSDPVEYAALADGPHDFRLRATDRAGNTTTVDRDWIIDSGPPETTIDSGPTLTADNTPTFGFSSNETGAGFGCSLDGGPAVSCDTGSFTPTSSLGDGSHTFSVIATDVARNEDPSAAIRSFTVDTVAPVATITGSPPARLKLKRKKVRVTFAFEASEGASFSCKLDSGPAQACSSPTSYKVRKGQHRFEVMGTDGAGNAGPPDAHSFKVKKKRRR